MFGWMIMLGLAGWLLQISSKPPWRQTQHPMIRTPGCSPSLSRWFQQHQSWPQKAVTRHHVFIICDLYMAMGQVGLYLAYLGGLGWLILDVAMGQFILYSWLLTSLFSR